MPVRDHRNPYTRYKKNKDYADGITVPPHWAAWVRTHRNQFVRILGRSKQEGGLPKVMVYITSGPTKGMALDLSGLTVKELDTLQVFLNETIDLARVVCTLGDRRAHELVEAGLDDNDNRVDRVFPEVVNRAWSRGIDGQSLLQRLAYLPDSDGADGASAGEPGDDGSGVAEQDEERFRSPHDLAPLDLN